VETQRDALPRNRERHQLYVIELQCEVIEVRNMKKAVLGVTKSSIILSKRHDAAAQNKIAPHNSFGVVPDQRYS
jgi:hypothetical protein